MSAELKDKIYDAEISPLMAKILEICKREKIGMLCSFCFGQGEDGETQCCTSAMLGGDYPTSESLAVCVGIIAAGSGEDFGGSDGK